MTSCFVFVVFRTRLLRSKQIFKSAIYCAGCNERFLPSGRETETCPRCGAEFLELESDPLSETLLIHAVDDSQDSDPDFKDAKSGELDQLIGSDLHVYRCETFLGSGAMGRVYLARHNDLHRRCALKILLPHLIEKDADYIARFEHEGRASAALVHPNIVTTHAIGKFNGFHFLEMEFVIGNSLQQLIEHEGQLRPIRAATLIAGIAEGLAAAHRENIIHRDLKPDNVLLTHDGIPKISDFGLAKRVATKSPSATADVICGTPNFMAPELFQGESATPASDVYALGVCLFLLLTGRLPFVAGSFQKLLAQVSSEPLPNVREANPDVPLEMAECLSLMMAKSPANRPRDGIEAVQLLHAILGEVRDIESLLNESFSSSDDVTWTREEDRYTVNFLLPEGRRQTVYVESSDHSMSERLLLIYSLCCDAKPEFYEQALRLNSEIPHGGLSIREIDGKSKFVMVDTYPRATVDTEEMKRSVLEVAYRADDIEMRLTGLDNN